MSQESQERQQALRAQLEEQKALLAASQTALQERFDQQRVQHKEEAASLRKRIDEAAAAQAQASKVTLLLDTPLLIGSTMR